MRKEIFSIRNLSVSSEEGSLRHICISLYEGEITGFMGLRQSGMQLIADVLIGVLKPDKYTCTIGKYDIKDISKYIQLIDNSRPIVEDWSVGEYIALVSQESKFIYRSELFHKKIDIFLVSNGVSINSREKLGNLTELEFFIVDILKAKYNNKKIVIIKNEFYNFSKDNVIYIRYLIKNILNKSCVIICNYSYYLTKILSDKLLVFRNGKIVKKYKSKQLYNISTINRYLSDDRALQYQNINNEDYNFEATNNPVYLIKNINIDNIADIKFNKGSITTITSLSREKKRLIFDILIGKKDKDGIQRYIDCKLMQINNCYELINNRVVYIPSLFDEKDIFVNMTLSDNIILPSLVKLTELDYAFNNKKLRSMLDKKYTSKNIIGEAFDKQLILMTILERWKIFKPKVIIFFEPFIKYDLGSIKVIKKYMLDFKLQGAAVVIINTRKEYVLDITDIFIKF